jgi:hypothetical protein
VEEVMARRGVGVASVGLALGAAGCSLLFNLDGYAGSPEGGIEVAGGEASDSPVAETRTSDADASAARDGGGDEGETSDAGDSGAPDALEVPEGPEPSDAGDSGDSAPPDSCADFCDDFDDRTSNLQGAWTSFTPPTSGIAEITSAHYKSPPHSAHFSLPQQSGGTNATTLALTRSLPASHAFAVDFDFTVTYTPSQFAMFAFANTFDVAAGTDYAGATGLGTTADGSYAYFPFEPDGGTAAKQTTHNLGVVESVPGTWRHFHFEETFDPNVGRIYLALDGTTAFEDTGVDTLPASMPTTVAFAIGPSLTGQTSAVDLYVDNVQIQPMP